MPRLSLRSQPQRSNNAAQIEHFVDAWYRKLQIFEKSLYCPVWPALWYHWSVFIFVVRFSWSFCILVHGFQFLEFLDRALRKAAPLSKIGRGGQYFLRVGAPIVKFHRIIGRTEGRAFLVQDRGLQIYPLLPIFQPISSNSLF